MSNHQAFLFGSFTEDEINSLLRNKGSEKAEKVGEKKVLQFGSVDFDSVNKCISVSEEILGKDVASSKGKASLEESLSSIKKRVEEKNVKSVNGSGDVSKENGHDHSEKSFLSGNGVKKGFKGGSDASSASEFEVEDGILDDFPSLTLQNGNAATPSTPWFKDEPRKTANGTLVASAKKLLPRGLVNLGNLCFLNSTVQALLCCSPFVQLLQELRTQNIHKAEFPTLAAFVEFVSEFDVPTGSNVKKKDSAVLDIGRPFRPAMFEGVLKNFTPDITCGISGRPRQEDAQEFLSFVMDQMHDELLKLEGQSHNSGGTKSSLVSSSEGDDWETVGPKNKSAVTRTQSFVPSKLSDIFGGKLRSVVTAKGNRPSATVQPFLLLHLDIHPEAVHTIEDALKLFSAPETLEGYRTPATAKGGFVTASKSTKIQSLSKIMILHLMRFGYGSQGSTKLLKLVRFPLEFVLGRELFVTPPNEGRRYELVATITHHGREPSKGHYTADARHANGQWLRFDDASVTAIGASKVLHGQAYVLVYKQL